MNSHTFGIDRSQPQKGALGLLCALFAVFVFVLQPVFLSATAAPSASIVVTTPNDVIAADADCSLREAIIAANTDAAYNGCPTGSGVDTITFDPALPQSFTITLTTAGQNENAGASGDLDIVDDLRIEGWGETRSIIDGNGTDRVFEIHTGATLTMTAVTVQNGDPGFSGEGAGFMVWGRLTLADSVIQGNQRGGLSNDGGWVTLTNVRVLNNSGAYGIQNKNQATLTFTHGAVSGNQAGGIYNAAAAATLQNLTISENVSGGGVYNLGNTTLTRLTLTHSNILTNTTSSNGGGIYNEGNNAKATISAVRISGNAAAGVGGGAGGGVYNNGIMTLSESSIDQNTARTGGGIEHSGSTLTLTNVTISGNQAGDDGGGLYNRSSAVLTNVTIVNNAASGPDTGPNIFNDEASMAIGNSIISGANPADNCFNSSGFMNSMGHNIDSGDSCNFHATEDMRSTDALLGPLQDNGGETMTHALAAGSPAIDLGDDGLCPIIDQRGFARPQGTGCDIGAYEAGAIELHYRLLLPLITRTNATP